MSTPEALKSLDDDPPFDVEGYNELLLAELMLLPYAGMRIDKLVEVADELFDSFRLDDISRFKHWLNSARLAGSFRNEPDERRLAELLLDDELVNERSDDVDELSVLSDWSTSCVATLLTVSTMLVDCSARLLGEAPCDDDEAENELDELGTIDELFVVFDEGRRKILNVERRRESGLLENLFKFECSFQICEFLL